MSSGKNAQLQATASVKNEPGTLVLSKKRLTWLKLENAEVVFKITLSTITSLFASKPNVPNRKLKIVQDVEGSEPITFTFPNGDDAEKFKVSLSEVVTKNKDTKAAAEAQAAAEAAAAASGPGQSSTMSSSSLRAATNQKKRLNKNDLKLAVLTRNPELGKLHGDLVRNGLLSEAEFWEGREHLLLAEAAAESQRKGKPSLMVNPQPVRDETGNAKVAISNEMIEEIFEEFPVVRRAYDENVPKRLSDQDFWRRYMVSKLSSRNSASARGAASEHTVQADPIFDKYLEKEDDGLQPRRERKRVAERLVDLDATEEDHPETGNTQDVTMQAGKQRQALPLIRRFNEHSERLLNAALGSEPPAKRRRIDPTAGIEDNYIDQIVIDELEAPQSSSGIPLEMKDQQRYFDGGRPADAMQIDTATSFDATTVMPALVQSLDTWQTDMARIRLDKKSADDALSKMTNNVKARLEVRGRRNDFPDIIHEQMTSLQTATSEFLRQFWSAIHPPPPEQGLLSVATPEQLAARAAKMIEYLDKTKQKVNTIVDTARQVGADVNKVQAAFEHTLNAVDAALHTYESRGRRL